MRIYSRKAGTETRLSYGTELAAGLASFPEAAPLAAHLEELNDRLESAMLERVALEKPVRKARSAVRACDYRADAAIRSMEAAARIADRGMPGGPVRRALFPDGLSAEVEPQGRGQVAAARRLLDRLGSSAAPGIATLRDEWVPRLSETLADLEETVGALDQAVRAVQQAFLVELTAREEHALEVERIMGRVKALYPGDRARREAIFPVSRRRRRGPGADGEVESTDPIAA